MKSFLFILIATIFILLIDIYFFRAVKALLHKKRNKTKIYISYFYWGITLFSIISIIIYIWHHTNKTPPSNFFHTYILGIVFVILISKIIGCVVLLLNDLIRFIQLVFIKGRQLFNQPKTVPIKADDSTENKISRGDFLKKVAFFAGALPLGIFSYGMVETAFDYQIRKTKLNIKGFSHKFKGLKIVQISDIHTGSFLNTNYLQQIVKTVNSLSPDIVFFTGDLVNQISEEAIPFISTLKQIKAKQGVFSILGNHDYGDYFYDKDDKKSKAHNRALMIDIHQRLGWKLLLNEHFILNYNKEELAIIGVENWGKASRFPKYGDISQAQKGIEQHPHKLLLSHDPSHWDRVVKPQFKDIKMTFTGHTHGMQFGVDLPDYKWSPAKYLYPEWAGLYQKKSQQIYVNRGIGFIGYPGRVGIKPEITIFEFC